MNNFFKLKISSYKVKAFRNRKGKLIFHYLFSISDRKSKKVLLECGGPGLGLISLIKHRINPIRF